MLSEKVREVLSSTSVSAFLPVLSLSGLEALSKDLQRAVTALGQRRDHGLRQIAAAIEAFYLEAKTRDERLEQELTIDTR